MFAGFLGLISRGRARATAADPGRRRALARPPLGRVPRLRGAAPRRLARRAADRRPARRGDAEALGGGPVEELVLGGLERGDALGAARGGRARPSRSPSSCSTLSLGNPLALLELPSILSDEQRRGVGADRLRRPAPGGALRRGVRAPRRGRRAARPAALLLVAAASFDRALEPVIAACRDLGIDDEALERCEAAGLLETGRRRLHGSPIRCCAASSTAAARRGRAPARPPRARRPHLAGLARLAPRRRGDRARRRGRRRARPGGASAPPAAALTRRPPTRSSGPRRLSPSRRRARGRLFAAGLAAAMGGGLRARARRCWSRRRRPTTRRSACAVPAPARRWSPSTAASATGSTTTGC